MSKKTEEYVKLEKQKGNTLKRRENLLNQMSNKEIDELIKQPSTVQRKIYLSEFKKKNK